eukprot:SAG22_NODE_24_length_30194_cov_6.086327_5_plen_88_part_00
MSLFEQNHPEYKVGQGDAAAGAAASGPTPAGAPKACKEGYLEKFTDKVGRFSRRYFILDPPKGELRYSRGTQWTSYPLDRRVMQQHH